MKRKEVLDRLGRRLHGRGRRRHLRFLCVVALFRSERLRLLRRWARVRLRPWMQERLLRLAAIQFGI